MIVALRFDTYVEAIVRIAQPMSRGHSTQDTVDLRAPIEDHSELLHTQIARHNAWFHHCRYQFD